MTATVAHTIPGAGHLSAVGRLSANASIAALIAGVITLGQWLVIDRPQQDRLSEQGVAAMRQADAHSLADRVSTEIDALSRVVAAQRRSGKLLPSAKAALTTAQALHLRAFEQTYKVHDYEHASATLFRIHDIVQGALCLEQHFVEACKLVPRSLAGSSTATR
jgi:hypothetical protein